ncbi:MAG: hypothetical protein ACI9Y1_002343 [Lentisphaeria bacterium]|jgi:hypothetical protein
MPNVIAENNFTNIHTSRYSFSSAFGYRPEAINPFSKICRDGLFLGISYIICFDTSLYLYFTVALAIKINNKRATKSNRYAGGQPKRFQTNNKGITWQAPAAVTHVQP